MVLTYQKSIFLAKNRKTNISAPLDDFVVAVEFSDPDGGISLGPADTQLALALKEKTKQKDTRQEGILNALAEGPLTTLELAEALGLAAADRNSVRSICSRLKKSGLVIKDDKVWALNQ